MLNGSGWVPNTEFPETERWIWFLLPEKYADFLPKNCVLVSSKYEEETTEIDLEGKEVPDSERFGSFGSPSKSKNNSPYLGVFSFGLSVFFLPGSLCSTTPIFFQRLRLTVSFLGTSHEYREVPAKRKQREIRTVLR